MLQGQPERKASVTICLSIRPKYVSDKATFEVSMKPFHSFKQTFQIDTAMQRLVMRVFPILLCVFSPMVLADATSDIEGLIQNKQWAQAQRLIQTELDKKEPTAQSPQWRLLNSQVLAGSGNIQAAIDVLQSLIQEFPELPEPYNNLAVLLASQGNYESAAEALHSAIQARPNYKIAIQNLGDLYTAMAQQAYDKAKTMADDKSLLPLPKPAAAITTTTNLRSVR